MIEWLNIQKGEILLNDFLDINLPIEDQEWSLKQDMLQIGFFNKKFIIDIGWTKEFEFDGKFRILLISNLDWDKPLKNIEVDIINLPKTVNDLINYVSNL